MSELQALVDPWPGYQAENLRVDTAVALLQRLVSAVNETETVGLPQALDRVLAEDVISPVNVPPHDNAAMDGYAFDAQRLDLQQAVTLRCVGTVLAGSVWADALQSGECVKIMTGAPMPEGLNTVVPRERVEARGDEITVPGGLAQWGDHRRLAGEDLRRGQPALAAGTLLGPAALGLIASLGLDAVHVRRRVRVAYCSTGDELLTPGEPPRPGALYDSNRYTLGGLLSRLGVETIDLGVVPDEPAALRATFLRGAEVADAVITSGGASFGDADHTALVLKDLGEALHWQMAMRPGRPFTVGRLRDGDRTVTLWSLPGNPVAAMVSFLTLVRPALLKMMGAPAHPPLTLQLRSQEAFDKRPGRAEWLRGVVSPGADGVMGVRSTGSQGSGVLRSMAEANALIVLPHDQGPVAVGDLVPVWLLEGLI